MSKAGKVIKNISKKVEKVVHGNKIKTFIQAGLAAAGPPLGPILGQHGLNIATFCKDFNERTKDIKEGVPLPTRIYINPDRSYHMVIHKPPTTFLLKQAAGIQRAAMEPGREVCGKITLKHLYEIAKIKSEDPPMECLSLEEICKKFIGIAHSCGIEVVHSLDPAEYQKFLEERKDITAQQKKELQEKREAKMLRTT
ncbi:mitochondrial ribosomal protein L11 [Rhodnius prolixus]|uniref:Large ribosomal subunit protein uL11m n=2 Tax=Rhodnius TaxID=13248 RepID=R4G413_RHOPR